VNKTVVRASMIVALIALTSGRVDLGWPLAAPGSGIRAGTHQLTIRWKVESITP